MSYSEDFAYDDFSNYNVEGVLSLRDWQRRAKDFFFEHNGKAIFECSTGVGKTYSAIDIIQDILYKEPKLKILIVVPKNVILETGWYKELVEAGIPIQNIGVFYGDVKEYAQITITNMQSLNRIPLEIFDMTVLDECFTRNTQITLMNKNNRMGNKHGYITTATIKGIVEQKSKGPVVSFNTIAKQFELKSIVSWYKIRQKRKIIKLTFNNGVEIKVTPNQEFYTGKKYISGTNLKVDDNIIYFGKHNNIFSNEDVEQLVISGMLGDGHVQDLKTRSRIKFSSIHKEYIQLHKDILNVFENNKSINLRKNKGYKKDGVIYTYDSNIYRDLYLFNQEYKKHGVKFLLNQLNSFGLALWFYDDGSFQKNTGGLHTESFSHEENILIQKYLIKNGFDCVIQKTTKIDGRVFFYIRFRKNGVEKAFSIMQQYPLKCFEYKYNKNNLKINKYYKYEQKYVADMNSLNNIFTNFKRSDKRPSFIKCVKKEVLEKKEYVYDIEVEDNHNFFANNILSHNCHNYGTPRMLELIKQPMKYKLGLTATLKRMDNKHFDILKLFDYNLFKYSPKEALDDGVLNPFVFYNIGVKLDVMSQMKYDDLTQQLNSIFKTGGSYEKLMRTTTPLKFKMLSILNERKTLVNNYVEKFSIAREIIRHHTDNKIIVFNQFNTQTSKLYWHLLEDNRDCRIVHSGIPKDKREKALTDFKHNKFDVLLTSKVLDEGMNIPKLDVAIIMAGDSTDKQTIQRMGRVLRKKKGQDSMLYQIYCIGTMEERNADKRAKIFKNLASDYKEMRYDGPNSLKF